MPQGEYTDMLHPLPLVWPQHGDLKPHNVLLKPSLDQKHNLLAKIAGQSGLKVVFLYLPATSLTMGPIHPVVLT